VPGSLSYAERGKDNVENALHIHLPDDITQSLKGITNFESDEFRSLVAFKGRPSRLEAFGTALEGRLVPRIDGDGMIHRERSGGGDDIADGITQWFDAVTRKTGERDGTGLTTPIGMNAQIAFVENEDAAVDEFR